MHNDKQNHLTNDTQCVSWCKNDAQVWKPLLVQMTWRETETYEPHYEKTCLCHMQTTKAQISLRIRAVWLAPSLFTASTCRKPFFEALDQIIPSFASKTVDEKFAFIMECKDYDIACVCVTNIWKMFRARDKLSHSNINASHRTNATNADSSWYSRCWHCFDVETVNLWYSNCGSVKCACIFHSDMHVYFT